MPVPAEQSGVLLKLAAEGILPVLGGCAGALIGGGAEGGAVGVIVGQVVERAINIFGGHIIERWQDWFQSQPEAARLSALAELAALPPDVARREAEAVLKSLAPDASTDDIAMAAEYLSAMPRTVDRALLVDTTTGQRSLSVALSWNEPQSLAQLLPMDVPPYPAPSALPDSPYRLEQLLGTGGFGAVYRASAIALQHLPLAIKFCLDRSLVKSLQLERDNLERLMRAGGEAWSKRIVRLYGYDLNHRTPYLVYEYIPGGDLLHYLGRKRLQLNRALTPDEVLTIVEQITEALAFAHQHGLVHRDLKPANILVDGELLKLADFGLGSINVTRAIQASRIGATTISMLTAGDQASLFRGAGTPLYMSPEQRRGATPDPRHDLYSLGVMWFQLLAGDTTRELHAGWAKELIVRHKTPREHIDLIERCVGWFDERPSDAQELLKLLRRPPAPVEVIPVKPEVESKPVPKPDRERQEQLLTRLRELQELHERDAEARQRRLRWRNLRNGLLLFAGVLLISTGTLFGLDDWLETKLPWLAIVLISVTAAIVAGFGWTFVFPSEEAKSSYG
jgi:serine/threonine protein kinase